MLSFHIQLDDETNMVEITSVRQDETKLKLWCVVGGGIESGVAILENSLAVT